MPFDFDAAVSAPFRMQPGLRRMAAGSRHLTPMQAGSRHQREKLAVLSAFWPQALCAQPGFDAAPALDALCAHAAAEHPQAWAWDGRDAQAPALGTAVSRDGQVRQLHPGSFGLGDEAARCLAGLPAAWRLAGLLSLAFEQDLAIVDAGSATIPWLAVALPSHWAPQAKVGRHFAEVHGPVADNQMLLKAAASLLRLVSGREHWERFVWTVTDQPRLHAHPAHVDTARWPSTDMDAAWWRTEHQTFLPLPAQVQAPAHAPAQAQAPAQTLFTIHVQVQALPQAIDTPARAAALHAAIASMSPAVLAYRNLAAVRAPLLAWLAARA